jgi:transcription elongation factor Elf1
METEPEVKPVVLSAQERREITRLVRKRLRQMVEPFDATSPWWSWSDTMDRFEPIPAGYHSVTMPSMLVQIEAAAEGVRGASSSTGAFESRPAAALDAIDALERIRRRAAATVGELGGEPGIFVETNLRHLSDLAASVSDAQLVALRRLAMSWWTQAKIVAGFEEPAQRPHVRCPRCDAMDSLRVRLDIASRFGLAMCTECEAAWTDDPESQRANGDGDIRMLLREIERQETEQAAGGIDPDEIHVSYRFMTRHDARAADPKGEDAKCYRCSTPKTSKTPEVVVRHNIGTAHYCSACDAWHPGRPRLGKSK